MNIAKKYLFVLGLLSGLVLGSVLFSQLDALLAQDGSDSGLPPQIAVGKKVRRCVLVGADSGSFRTIDAIHGSWIVFDNKKGISKEYGARFECIDMNHPAVAWLVFE